jgi:hypothetical protein
MGLLRPLQLPRHIQRQGAPEEALSEVGRYTPGVTRPTSIALSHCNHTQAPPGRQKPMGNLGSILVKTLVQVGLEKLLEFVLGDLHSSVEDLVASNDDVAISDSEGE